MFSKGPGMDYKCSLTCLLAVAFSLGIFMMPAHAADDLSDGISEYTDENVSGDDNIGNNKDNNINFIVVDALGKAKSKKEKDANDKGNITNVDDGSVENNTNSVVVEAGSKVDKVYNIIIEK
jgi:hypothetical protein